MPKNVPLLKSAQPGELIFSEGYMGQPAVYLIIEGRVELSTVRGERRIVLDVLDKGHFFGESVLVSTETRTCTARALSYCRLQLIDDRDVQDLVLGAGPALRHLLRSLILSNMKRLRALAAHGNLEPRPDVVAYAHILALLAKPAEGGASPGGFGARRGGRERDGEAVVPAATAIGKCRDITGHTRQHATDVIRRMARLGLVALDGRSGPAAASDGSLGAAQLRFNPQDIAARAQAARDEDDDKLRVEPEAIGLDELAALTGAARGALLRRLADGELADELLSFHRADVLRVLGERGGAYFGAPQPAAEPATS